MFLLLLRLTLYELLDCLENKVCIFEILDELMSFNLKAGPFSLMLVVICRCITNYSFIVDVI